MKNQWQPVIFDEESRRIGDLADFWLECIRQWESARDSSPLESRRIDALLALPESEIEDQARKEFLKLVDASGKRALLLIDNINDIFSAIHHNEPLMRLRSFLMADSRVMIIGAATQWFSDVTHVDKPFFEFFREFELAALNFEEMKDCLRGIAEARGDQAVLDALEKRPGSIKSLHILTGGNPRLIRTFYRMLNESMNGELRQQLERLIDDYTPYLKAIIDALPRQQQRVLDAIALEWNPCDVATVARVTRIPSNQVSAQIRAMTKLGLVNEVEAIGTQKKKAYMLTDRFSNIHYLMRHGRSGQRRMHWFVTTLRVLFDDHQFADSAARTIKVTAQSGPTMQRDALDIAHAALESAGNEDTRWDLLSRLTGALEFDAEIDPEFAEELCREAISRIPEDALAYQKLARIYSVFRKDDEKAESLLRKAIELDPKKAYPHSNLAIMISKDTARHDEARREASIGLQLAPALGQAQDVFRYVCFDHTPSLASTLPEIGQWSSQHPDDLGLVSFLIDTWVALAILSGPAEAAKLLESQPPDVQLMFEVVSDAFKAHADKDHLHRLAPERRAPVMELLKRLMT